MTSFHHNQIRALTQDDLQIVVGGGNSLPIPPIQGGPIHTPVTPIIVKKPAPGPLVPLPMPVIVV